MGESAYNLAIETSSRRGSVTIGHGSGSGAKLLETLVMGQQRRNAMDLMPAIDELCRRHSVTPTQIGALFVSVGPGSFTGLRIGITTAKTLAATLKAQVVAVPTLDAVIENVSTENAPPHHPLVAVMLNAKRGQCYTGLYRREENTAGSAWAPAFEPRLMSVDELIESADRPLAILSDQLPKEALPDGAPEGVVILDAELAIPSSETVWRLGQAKLAKGETIDPLALNPLYIRLPEAEEVWQARNPGAPGVKTEADAKA